MKNKITAKINEFGRMGRIVSRIMQGISLACACVLLICTLIVCLFVPTDSLKFSGTAQGILSYSTEQKVIGFNHMESQNKNFMGADLKIDVSEEADQTEDNVKNIDISASAEKITEKQFKGIVALVGSGATLILLSIYVIFVFAVKLCKALEVCNSPFEADILNAMKKLAYSFIPYGIVSIIFMGVSAISIIMTVIVVFMLMYIFSYGAELQQELDDTV